MKKTLFLLPFFFALNSMAQNNLYGPTLSYQNQSGNVGKIGAFLLRSPNTLDLAFKIDASANFSYFRNQTVVIPEVGLTLYPSIDYLILPTLETEVTPYTFTPKVGFSILTILDFSLGYGFEIETKKDLKPIKGFTFSFGINVPLNLF